MAFQFLIDHRDVLETDSAVIARIVSKLFEFASDPKKWYSVEGSEHWIFDWIRWYSRVDALQTSMFIFYAIQDILVENAKDLTVELIYKNFFETQPTRGKVDKSIRSEKKSENAKMLKYIFEDSSKKKAENAKMFVCVLNTLSVSQLLEKEVNTEFIEWLEKGIIAVGQEDPVPIPKDQSQALLLDDIQVSMIPDGKLTEAIKSCESKLIRRRPSVGQ